MRSLQQRRQRLFDLVHLCMAALSPVRDAHVTSEAVFDSVSLGSQAAGIPRGPQHMPARIPPQGERQSGGVGEKCVWTQGVSER